MKTVYFLSHPQKQCGVHQYGKLTAAHLAKSTKYRFVYKELGCFLDVQKFLSDTTHEEVAAVIFNYHPGTMPWMSHALINVFRWPAAFLVHDQCCPHANVGYHIHVDPTHPECNAHFSVGRPVPEYDCKIPKPASDVPIIGTFGMAFNDKVAFLVMEVCKQFAKAHIRVQMPFGHFGDQNGASAHAKIADARRYLKPGITLEANHQFMKVPQLLDWLAGNTLNAFTYAIEYGRGPASVTDLALAVPRPIALTRSWQFRHIPEHFNRVERWSMREIIDSWTGNDYIKWDVLGDYERIVGIMLGEK